MSASAIMAIIAGVLLLFSFGRGRNTVWGAAILGVIIGVIVALITSNWDWLLFIFAAGTFIGVISKWTGRFSDANKTTTQRSVSSMEESEKERILDAPYIADSKTLAVHLKACPLVQSIEEKDVGRYTSVRLAKMAGYAPCKICRPDKK